MNAVAFILTIFLDDGRGHSKMALLNSGCVAVEALSKQSAILLFLHGLGDTGYGWSTILREYCPSHVKIVCPTASTMPVTVNNGARMPSWFDIYSLSDRGGLEDENGIRKAAKDVHDTLDALQAAGTPPDRIVLGGFSQGGSLASFSALTYKRPLAGLILLSCWIPVTQIIEKEALADNKQIPILHCHGEDDNVVKLAYGKMSADFLKRISCPKHEFKTYPNVGHSASEPEMKHVQDWISGILKPQGGLM